jgi:Kef-type K+ transport system membrane component KefB
LLDFVTASVFGEIAALLMLAAFVGLIGTMLRQPLIVSFIAVGLLAGPSVLGIVRSSEQIELLSQLGIAVLLFLVGIKLDVQLIRSLGTVSLMTGLGQVLFTSIIGFAIGLGLGFNTVESLYIAVALTFSSTIIIVKLLSDKREIDSLHGQIALGFLIVQDLVVVLAMIVLSAVGIGAASDAGALKIVLTLGWGFALLGLVILFIRFLADPITERLARSPELLMTFAIGQAAIIAATADAIGLGKELGGLLAGVSLASAPYREMIAARLAPLRDFLLLFFFIALGAKLDLTHLGANLTASVIFSLFVLIGNPAIVLAIMGAMGYRKRTGFLAGLTVAQISEFSLIFVAMGVTLGHVQNDALGLVTLVGLITIAVSTYMITYSHQLYRICEPLLGVFERRHGVRDAPDTADRHEQYDVILFGLGRFGSAIATRLRERGKRVLGVDFNPLAVRQARAAGIDAEYGDASDPEFLAAFPLRNAAWVIAALPVHQTGVSHEDLRRTIIQSVRAAGYSGRIAVVSHNETDSQTLRAVGADMILEPFQDAADRALERLSETLAASGPGPERSGAGAAAVLAAFGDAVRDTPAIPAPAGRPRQ